MSVLFYFSNLVLVPLTALMTYENQKLPASSMVEEGVGVSAQSVEISK